MSFTMTFTDAVTTVEGQLAYSKEISGDLKVSFDISVDDGETDLEAELQLIVANILGIYIISDQDVTIETNDGTTPDNTLALKANVPYKWHDESYDTLKLTVDVTSIFITNASGETAAIKIRAICDPTP